MMYPIFRTLEGFNRHYCILSDKRFVEASKIGENWSFQQVEANQYPEMLRIQDMIACNFQFIASKKAIEELFNDFLEKE